MMLLRLFGYIMVYAGVGAVFYSFISDQFSYLMIGAVLLIIGALLIKITQDNSQASRQSSMWDWLDWLELPLDFIVWLFKAIFKIFD